MLLGRNWLVRHKVVHGHFNNCLFIGTQQRQQIFTTPGIDKTNEEITDDVLEGLSHDFTGEAADSFLRLVQRHKQIFHQGSLLRQAHTSSQSALHTAHSHPYKQKGRYHEVLCLLQKIKRPHNRRGTATSSNTPDLERSRTSKGLFNY